MINGLGAGCVYALLPGYDYMTAELPGGPFAWLFPDPEPFAAAPELLTSKVLPVAVS